MIVMIEANPMFPGKRGALLSIPARHGYQRRVGRELPQMLDVSHPMATQSDQSDA